MTQQEGMHTRVEHERGTTLLIMGELVTIKLTGQETGGAFALVEQETQPGAGVSFLHTHPPAETFYVLEGEYEFYGQNVNGKYTIRGVKGDVIHIQGGMPHGVKNVSDRVGRLLVIFQPAGIMELFFQELGAPVEDVANLPQPVPPDPTFVGSLFHKYGILPLEPPG